MEYPSQYDTYQASVRRISGRVLWFLAAGPCQKKKSYQLSRLNVVMIDI